MSVSGGGARSVQVNELVIEPANYCIGRFKDKIEIVHDSSIKLGGLNENETGSTGDEFETKWVGFDKYKKFIYGVQSCENKNEASLLMQSIFGGQPQVVDILRFSCNENSTNIVAISQCGDYLGFVHHLYSGVLQELRSVFHLFSISDRTCKTYRLMIPFNMDDDDDLMEISHSSLFGWICSFYFRDVTDPHHTKFAICRLEPGDTDTYRAELLTIAPIVPANELIIWNDSFVLFSNDFCFVYKYDVQRDSWRTENLTATSEKVCEVVTCSEKDESAFVLTVLGTSNCAGECTRRICKLVDNHWEFVGITINSNLLRLCLKTTFSWDGILFLNPAQNKTAVFISTNVLSLQDIAFRRLFIYCISSGVPLKSIMEYLILPRTMRRKFFGHDWFWENK